MCSLWASASFPITLTRDAVFAQCSLCHCSMCHSSHHFLVWHKMCLFPHWMGVTSASTHVSTVWDSQCGSCQRLLCVRTMDFFATTSGFGHQIDIAYKITPRALFDYLRNLIQRFIISRPYVGSRSVRTTVRWFQIGLAILDRFCMIPTLSKMSMTQSYLWSNANIKMSELIIASFKP